MAAMIIPDKRPDPDGLNTAIKKVILKSLTSFLSAVVQSAADHNMKSREVTSKLYMCTKYNSSTGTMTNYNIAYWPLSLNQSEDDCFNS